MSPKDSSRRLSCVGDGIYSISNSAWKKRHNKKKKAGSSVLTVKIHTADEQLQVQVVNHAHAGNGNQTDHSGWHSLT